MPSVILPPRNTSSPLASMRGDHIGLRVGDIEAIKRWYVEKLDFRIVKEWSFGDQRFAFIAPPNDDNFKIELLGGGERPTPTPAFKDLMSDSTHHEGYHHLCFDVANMDETIAELRRRGVEIPVEPFLVADIGRRLAFFEDPWHNIIELSEVVD